MEEPILKQIGKYEITGLIGKGGMGVVYRALDNMGRDVAIKTLYGSYTDDPDLLKRFYIEARATGSLQHKNIVTIFALGDEGGTPYMVMEFLDGKSLSEIISSRLPISLADKLGLVIQVCEGLHYAHQKGLVHRDIKPANILILKDGTAKIVDFGIARVGLSESITRTGQLIGSMYYMSPEQLTEGSIDGRSDIFSTGVMLYEFIAQTRPFDAADPPATFLKITREEPLPLSKYLPDCPLSLEEAIRKALAKDPEQRYQSADELAFDLSQIQENLKKEMVQDFLETAIAAINREDWEGAIQHLQEIVKINRQHPEANKLLREVRQSIQQQQRSVRILQLRSQAEVAIAGCEFADALSFVEEALRIDSENGQILQLRHHIREAAARERDLRDSLQRGEAALYAGDLDEAERAIRIALQIDSSNTDAQALGNVLSKELKERSNRAQVRKHIDEARNQISKQEFSSALLTLEEARSLDPSDSAIRELINWASRGRQQELRRKAIEEATTEIGQAFRAEDFSAALLLCDAALDRFPEEGSFLKLKHLAERQHESETRRRFIDEQTSLARLMAEAGKYEDAVECIEQSLQRYPGETNLEALLAVVRVELDRKRKEEDLVRQQDVELRAFEAMAESAERNRKSAVEAIRALRQALDDNSSIGQLAQLANVVNEVIHSGIEDSATVQANNLIADYKLRHERWRRDSEELEQLKIATSKSSSYSELVISVERARFLKEQHRNDQAIQATYAEIDARVNQVRLKRDSAVTEAMELAQSLDPTVGLDQLSSIERRLQQIASIWPSEATLVGLAEQASIYTREAKDRRNRVFAELRTIHEALSSANSRAQISISVERANLIAHESFHDGDVCSELEKVKRASDEMIAHLDSACGELKFLATRISSAGSSNEIEELHSKARRISASTLGFEETDNLFRQITRRVEERKRDYDHVCKSVTSLSERLPLAQSTTEPETINTLCRELVKNWQRDPHILELVKELDRAVESRVTELAAFNAKNDLELVASDRLVIPAAYLDKRRPRRYLIFIGFGTIAAGVLGVLAVSILPRTVAVRTLPPGANITVGDKKCSTPCMLRLFPGQHVFTAELPGFQPERQTIRIAVFGQHSITLTMSETAETSSAVSDKPASNASGLNVSNNAGFPANPPTRSVPVNPVLSETQVLTKPGQQKSPSVAGAQSAIGSSEMPTEPTGPAAPVTTPAPLALFEASSDTIEQGQTVTLTWQTQNATDIEIEGLGSVRPDGKQQLKPVQSTTYKLTGKGPGGEVVKTLRIEVQPVAKAATSEPPPAAVNGDLRAIRTTLEGYRAAYASESLDEMKRVWPEISKSDQKDLRGAFNNYNAIQLKLTCKDEEIHIVGGEAVAVCSQSFTYTQRNKVQSGPTGTASIKLMKAGDNWVITSISSH